MGVRKRGDIPQGLARGQDRFKARRRSRKVGARIPHRLWSLAVKLAARDQGSRPGLQLDLPPGRFGGVTFGRFFVDCDSVSTVHYLAPLHHRAIFHAAPACLTILVPCIP